MIVLHSTPSDEARQRLADLETRRRAAIANGEPIPTVVSRGYREPVVRASIEAETKEKCAYCESYIRHVIHGDVEHIKPKSKYPDLLLDYHNLTLACRLCNENKGDFWDEVNPLINPYDDDPADYLVALGPILLDKPGVNRGQLTILTLKLNRPMLRERRTERIDALHRLARQYAVEPDGPLKNALAEQLRVEAETDKEYSFTVRTYLRTVVGILLVA